VFIREIRGSFVFFISVYLRKSAAKPSARFPEVLILKDVRRSPNQAEAHPFLAGIARRKGIAVQHYHFMGNPVSMIVDHFVNSGLSDCLSRAKQTFGMVRTPRMWTRFAPALHPWKLRVKTS
jgi:hypothetical protein